MRVVAHLASVALGLSMLTSCSSDSDRLGNSDLEDALLTVEHLGDGFVVDDEDDDDDDEQLGCLDEIENDVEIGGDDEGEVEIAFELDDDFGVPAVGHAIKSYDDADDAADALEDLADELDGCDRVEETDSDGATIELDIETTTETADGADDQLNIEATGQISDGAFELPFNFSFRFARLDNNVVGIFFVNLGEVGDEPDVLLDAALARMDAVIDGGDPPPAEPLLEGYNADPGDGSFDEEEPDAGVTQPLDGGTYTWPGGITMTLTVDRVEPYGQRDDFCGDGSCGVAEKDDVRLVLKYEVTVPDDAEPFEPYGCPGELHVTSGNDDEAFGGVSGDYDSGIDGTMLPGTTKHGFAEYYVKKEYATEEFYVESTCGGADQTVFFRGTIASRAL